MIPLMGVLPKSVSVLFIAGLHLLLRIVHLDLKGAPPSLAYIRQLLPSLMQWGCTGLLLEYEDAFPYHSALRQLCAPHAYPYVCACVRPVPFVV
jgi:hypothetical protein